jgi:hypothetical protein
MATMDTATGAKQHKPVWGGNCPHFDQLQTGDLLFPRKPTPDDNALAWGTLWARLLDGPGTPDLMDARLRRTIGDILTKADPQLTERLQSDRPWRGYVADPTRWPRVLAPVLAASAVPPDADDAVVPPTVHESLLFQPDAAEHLFSEQNALLVQANGFPGVDDPDFLFAMLAILRIEFPDLLNQWLNMSVDTFIRSEIGRFFIDMLTSPDVRLSFFVGHVAIVLREQDGQSVDAPKGQVYVIEANITDYAHYRVSIHPYHCGTDMDPDTRPDAPPSEWAQEMRGWVNRRCALGEYVWHARPDLKGADPAWRTALMQVCKSLLGRPYGFFDHPAFGEDDRLYCSEFVYRAFKSLEMKGLLPGFAEGLRDRQTWGGMRDYLNASGQHEQLRLVKNIMRDRKIPADKPFFVMPPPLLWNSIKLIDRINPGWESAPYAPAF